MGKKKDLKKVFDSLDEIVDLEFLYKDVTPSHHRCYMLVVLLYRKKGEWDWTCYSVFDEYWYSLIVDALELMQISTPWEVHKLGWEDEDNLPHLQDILFGAEHPIEDTES